MDAVICGFTVRRYTLNSNAEFGSCCPFVSSIAAGRRKYHTTICNTLVSRCKAYSIRKFLILILTAHFVLKLQIIIRRTFYNLKIVSSFCKLTFVRSTG